MSNMINEPKGEDINPHESRVKRSLLRLGTIKQAKIHSSAQRPLKIVGHITREVVVCTCCCLPIETKNVIVPFDFTDDNIAFSSTGIGTYLYFHFFQYIMFLMFIVLCMAAIPTFIISYLHICDIINLCKLFKKEDIEGLFDFQICFLLADKTGYSFENRENWLLYFNSELFSHYRTFYDMQEIRQKLDLTLVDYNLVNFFTLVILMIINIMILVLIKNQAWIADILNYSPSDYSLLIDNIQHTVQSFREVKDNLPYLKDKSLTEIEAFKLYLLNDVIQYENHSQIKCLNLCFKLKELVNLEKEKEKDETKLLQALYSPSQIEKNKNKNNNKQNRFYYTGFCCCKKAVPVTQIRKTIADKQEQITKLIHLSTNDSLKSFAGSCFITFNQIKQQEDYYSYFPKSIVKTVAFYLIHIKNYLCCCFVNSEERKKYFQKQRLRVHSAPEPEDVLWENMELNQMDRIVRSILVYFISIVLIVISGFIVIGLNFSQYQADKNLDYNRFEVKYGVSFAISIAITIVNAIFQIVLEQLTHLERQHTKTQFYLSFSVKLAVFTFINSTVVPYVSNIIHDDENEIMHNTLINNLLFIFLSNSFLTPALWLFNIKFILNRVLIWWYTRNDKKILKSQKELNELYEFPNMDISFKYSFIAKTIAMTLFYLPIFPLGVIISFVGLIFAFCIERFMFTHFYKRPEMLNEKMCLFYLDYFIVILFVYGVGNWLFLSDLYPSKVWPFINIIFFGIMILFPFSILFKCNLIGISEAEVNQQTFDKMYFNFSNDYKRMNPMTRIQGIKEYLQRLKDSNMISDSVYQLAVMNMNKVNLLEMYYKSTLNQSNYQAGQQLMKMDTKLNNASQLNKAMNKILTNYGKKQRSDEEFPLDLQIKATFTNGIQHINKNVYDINNQGDEGYNNNNNMHINPNTFANDYNENIVNQNIDLNNEMQNNPVFNPYMGNIFCNQLFANGIYYYDNNNNEQQAQLEYNSQNINNPILNPIIQPNNNNIINDNEKGYSNQDYQYHHSQPNPQTINQLQFIPLFNSDRPISSEMNPFDNAINSKLPVYSINNIHSNETNYNVDYPTPEGQAYQAQNYNLGPAHGNTFQSYQKYLQNKNNLASIQEDNQIDADDIAISIDMSNNNKHK